MARMQLEQDFIEGMEYSSHIPFRRLMECYVPISRYEFTPLYVLESLVIRRSTPFRSPHICYAC